MQIKNEMSSADGVRNGAILKRDVGVPSAIPPHGYCFTHDTTYVLAQGDEICPDCERFHTGVIVERESEYLPEDIGADDEE